MLKFNVEVTDTFDGEANYCWVRRYTIETPDSPTQSLLVRRAKKAAGYSGCRATATEYGGDVRVDFAGMCIVMFISFKEDA